jgi:hypothetical protein
MRSAEPTLDPAAARLRFGAYEDDGQTQAAWSMRWQR